MNLLGSSLSCWFHCFFVLSRSQSQCFRPAQSTDRLIARRCVNPGCRLWGWSSAASRHVFLFFTRNLSQRPLTDVAKHSAADFSPHLGGTNGLHFEWQTTWPCLSQAFSCLLWQAQQLKSKFDQRWKAATQLSNRKSHFFYLKFFFFVSRGWRRFQYKENVKQRIVMIQVQCSSMRMIRKKLAGRKPMFKLVYQDVLPVYQLQTCWFGKMVPKSLNCTVSTKHFHCFQLNSFCFHLLFPLFYNQVKHLTLCVGRSHRQLSGEHCCSRGQRYQCVHVVAAECVTVISLWPQRWPLVGRHYLTLTRRVSADD